ncbi:hypothetical protein BDU57DRAFT_119724 [Ampelomyces quisqualis]|uniref:Uncharacterized protein n=1 Tax=Ampelomyces quisqualis TaxID=50730 RepID=A0A6A5QSW8_AMPQU|nr:hypothetical protein BDU57DRAFT_119724 [Ampelomyces quisqualis]
MVSNDAMGEQTLQEHIEPPAIAQEPVSADLEKHHDAGKILQNSAIANSPSAPNAALNCQPQLVQDHHLQPGDTERAPSITAQEQPTADGVQDVTAQPTTSSTMPAVTLQVEEPAKNPRSMDTTRGEINDQNSISGPAAQASPRKDEAEPTLNDPSSSAVHDRRTNEHTSPITTPDEDKRAAADDRPATVAASGSQPSAVTPELFTGVPYMLSGSLTATSHEPPASEVVKAEAQPDEYHEHLTDAEHEDAQENVEDHDKEPQPAPPGHRERTQDGFPGRLPRNHSNELHQASVFDKEGLGSFDEEVWEEWSGSVGEEDDRVEMKAEFEKDHQQNGEEKEDEEEENDRDESDAHDEDDRVQLMQPQLERRVAQAKMKLHETAPRFQDPRRSAIDTQFTPITHSNNVRDSEMPTVMRQFQLQPPFGYDQFAPDYHNAMQGRQYGRPPLSTYPTTGYHTRPTIDAFPYDPMNMRSAAQMMPLAPAAYQDQAPHDRPGMFFGRPHRGSEPYRKDLYSQDYPPVENSLPAYGFPAQHVRPHVPVHANRKTPFVPAHLQPTPNQGKTQPGRFDVKEEATDDDEPLKSRVQRHPSAISEPVHGSTSPVHNAAGKNDQSGKDEDVKIVSSQPKMGFKPSKTQKAAPKQTPKTQPAQPTPEEPAQPIQPQPDDASTSSIESIDWALPKYDAQFEPPKSKDDPTVAKISLPGLYREELLLSTDHPEQETHLLLNIFMPAQRALAVPDPHPAVAILNFHTLAVMCIEAFVQFEIGDEMGTGRGHWHDEYDRSETDYRRVRDAKDADPDEIFFAVIDRWRAGVESNKQPSKMIRGVQEFCDTVLDVVFYIKENGLWRKEDKKKGAKKADEDGDGDGAKEEKGAKRAGGKINEPKVTKKAKVEKKPAATKEKAKRTKKKSEPALTVFRAPK